MKTLKLLHFSDWHGKLPAIPQKYWGSDIAIALTGDICNNYPQQTFTPGIKQGIHFEPSYKKNTQGEVILKKGQPIADWTFWNYRKIDTAKEAILQNQWIEEKLIPHFDKCGIKKENILTLRGNHDWADLEKYFPNSLNHGAKTINFRGIKIGFLTGVNSIAGEWNDEITEFSFEKRVEMLDRDIDILITHAPPAGIKDGRHGYGSSEIAKAIFGKSSADIPYFNKLRYHLFGHAHESHGAEKHEITIDQETRTIRFYNAAESRFDLDIEIPE